MKKFFLFLIIILFVFLGLKILALKTELEKTSNTTESSTGFKIKGINRPTLKKQYDLRKIFDIKESAADSNKRSGQVSATEKTNQIFDNDVILRLKGIIKSKNSSFIVLIIEEKNKKKETIKLLQGENFRGYLVDSIYTNYVELSKDGNPGIRLKIFELGKN